MTATDGLLDHDTEECGVCRIRFINAQVARELLAKGDVAGAVQKWTTEVERRWRETKYFALWQAEKVAGRDPVKAFEERGWTP